MVGKDADKNEYWFFNDDPNRIYIKKLVIRNENKENAEYYWCYYDEEEKFTKLLESCNIKGIREKKLNENLKKIADKLNLKKMNN